MTKERPLHHHGVPTKQVPITPSYPFELHYVKALFLARQYKECTRRCEEVLFDGGEEMEPAHIIFLNFYAGLSHESLARLMHVYSVSRLPECDAAEYAYLKALDVSENGARPPEVKYTSPHPGAQHASVQHRCTKSTTADMQVTDDALDCTFVEPMDDEEKRASRLSFSWSETSTCIEDKGNEEPGSLHLPCSPDKAIADHKTYQKLSPQMASSLNPNNNLFETPSRLSRSSSQAEVAELSTYHTCISKAPYSVAANHNNTKYATYSATTPNLQTSPKTPTHLTTPSKTYLSPMPPPTKPTYKSHLTALHLQLQTHLTHLRTLQQETLLAQSQRVQRRTQSLLSVPTANPKPTLPQSRSFWSFKDPVAEMQEKNERIENGRARGWVCERFDGERYVRLAGEALAELGVKS